MAFKFVEKLVYGAQYVRSNRNGGMYMNVLLYHCSSSEESHEKNLPSEWYEKAFPKMIKMTQLLKNVDLIDGKLVKIDDYSTFFDDHIEMEMITFKSLVRSFIGSSHVQETMKRNVLVLSADGKSKPLGYFSKSSERQPMTLRSLTKVCDFLNISAQQRKVVRFTICPQVTQHRIWTGALEEILNELQLEMHSLNYQALSKGSQMGPQIVKSCLKFLDNTANSCDPDSTSWMRIAPTKTGDLPASHKWEDLLEMFNDLIKWLKSESRLQLHVTKLEIMKEGLFQIKDVLVDKRIAYKEARHQESLVQKKLSKTLGHSSQCLFTLLLYFLYGSIRDIDVDISGGVYGVGGLNKFCLCLGKILTSDEEKMVRSGVKQLDRALGLYRFVWETAGMKGCLELQGHLWCLGAKDRTLTFRGNMYFVHRISL